MNKILYKFGATWCNPCQTLKKNLPETFPEGMQYVEIDIDESKEMAKEFGIRSIPTLVMFDVDTGSTRFLMGAHSRQKIEDFINL